MYQGRSNAGNRPPRVRAVPRKLQNHGEVGAPAGHGKAAQVASPAAAVLSRAFRRGAAGKQHAAGMQREPVYAGRQEARHRAVGEREVQPAPATLQPSAQIGNDLGSRESGLSNEDSEHEVPETSQEAIDADDCEVSDAGRLIDVGVAGDREQGSRSECEILQSSNVGTATSLSAEVVEVCSPASTEPTRSGGASGAVVGEAGANSSGGGKGKAKSRKTTAGDDRKAMLRAGARKARGKAYDQWPISLLQRACAHRGVAKMSRVNSKYVLAGALEKQDKDMKRDSPHSADLDAIVHGRTQKKSAAAEIPDRVLHAFRSAQHNAGVTRSSREPFRYGSVDYHISDLFAIMDKEDGIGTGADAREASGGSASAAGAGDPSSRGTDGARRDESGDDTPARGARRAERKGPHCIMRLVGILVEDDVLPLLTESRLQPSRGQLDASAEGARSRVWQVAAERFRDKNHKVRRIVDDPMVDHCDPNTIQQPNITMDKLCKMWKACKAKWNQPNENKKLSGENESWATYCRGDTDIFILGEAIDRYPELNDACSSVIRPDDCQRESLDGGEEEGSATTRGAEQRAASRQEGERRLNKLNQPARKRIKANERTEEKEETAERIFKAACAEAASLFSKRREPTASNWQLKTQEAQGMAAALVHSEALLSSHKKFSQQLLEEEALGPGRNAVRIAFIKKKLAKIEQAMEDED